MKKMNVKMSSQWIYVLLLLVTSRSFAGIMVEPYLGYEITKSTETLAAGFNDGSQTLSTDVGVPGGVTGTDYGLRLGYKLPLLLWGALDLSMGNASLKFDNSGSYPSQTISRTVEGLSVGVDIPFLIRAWVGYGFSDQMKMTSFSNSGSNDTLKGTNTKLGIALNTLPLISLNLEYIMRSYTSGSGADFTNGSFSTVFKTATQNSVLLSVSIPFDF